MGRQIILNSEPSVKRSKFFMVYPHLVQASEMEIIVTLEHKNGKVHACTAQPNLTFWSTILHYSGVLSLRGVNMWGGLSFAICMIIVTVVHNKGKERSTAQPNLMFWSTI